MHFGERLRQLRPQRKLTQRKLTQRKLTQRDLATRIGMSDTYISKVENDNLHFGDFPSEKFIHKLADVLEADEEELLLLPDKVPAGTWKRVRERPEAFRTLAGLNDKTLDALLAQVGASDGKAHTKKRR